MKAFKILSLVCAVLLLTIPAAGVIAQEATGDRNEYKKQPYMDEPPKEMHRELYIKKEPHFATVTSTNGGDTPMFFEFFLRAEESLTIHATFAKESENGGEKTGIMIDFSGIVEYKDVNGDGMFQHGEDKAVSTYPLSGSFFQSDFIQGKNDFQDRPFGDEPEHHMDNFLEQEYMNGFNEGFNKGFHYGSYEGYAEEDFHAGEFRPRVHDHFSDEQLQDMLGIPENNGDQGENPQLSQERMIEEMGYFQYGFFNGFIMGFENGYEKRYNELKEENQAGTRFQEPPPEEEKPPEEERDGDSYDEKEHQEDIDELIRKGIVEHPKFRTIRYKPISMEREVLGREKQTFILSVEDQEGLFKIVCKISNDFTKIENGYLSPYSIKVDIHINNYNYKSPDTSLALITDVGITTSSEGEFMTEKKDHSYDEERKLAEDEEEIRINGPEFQGFFSWVKYAMCDGKNLTVKVGEMPSFYGERWTDQGYSGENFQGLIFNYPRANRIIHDPKLGFIQVSDINIYDGISIEEVETLLTGNIWIYAVTAVVALAFVGVTRKLRKKFY